MKPSARSWLSGKALCQMYLVFNIFVAISQLIDSFLHILVLYKLFYSSIFISFAALICSYSFSCLFKAICFNVSNQSSQSDLNILLAPFGNILYLFKYNNCDYYYYNFEYFRIYQLYKEYNRILDIYYYNKEIDQINNILLFAKCYINHYGNSLFDCFLHEIFVDIKDLNLVESLKEFIFLDEYDTDAFIQDLFDETQSNLAIICDNKKYVLYFKNFIKEYQSFVFT